MVGRSRWTPVSWSCYVPLRTATSMPPKNSNRALGAGIQNAIRRLTGKLRDNGCQSLNAIPRASAKTRDRVWTNAYIEWMRKCAWVITIKHPLSQSRQGVGYFEMGQKNPNKLYKPNKLNEPIAWFSCNLFLTPPLLHIIFISNGVIVIEIWTMETFSAARPGAPPVALPPSGRCVPIEI